MKKKTKNVNILILVTHGKDKKMGSFQDKKISDMINEPKYSYFTKNDNNMTKIPNLR